MKLSELDTSKNIKLMVYGNSGTGKTCFASGFPGPIWYADFDGKISSAANYLKEYNPEHLKQIDYEDFTMTPSKGGREVFVHFEKALKELQQSISEGKFKYKTVVIDSFSTFSEAMMQQILTSNPGVKRGFKDVPGMQDYLIMSSHFKRYLSEILSLPCNVVCIGHLQVNQDEGSGEIVRRPMLSGKMAELIPILFGEVYYAFTQQKDSKLLYVAQTRPNGKFVARTQFTKIPEYIPLSYDAIAKFMKA